MVVIQSDNQTIGQSDRSTGTLGCGHRERRMIVVLAWGGSRYRPEVDTWTLHSPHLEWRSGWR